MSQDPAVEGSTSPAPAQGSREASQGGQRTSSNGNGAGKDAQMDGGDGEAAKETPEELRAQLDTLRKDLANNMQKKQSIDRTLVRGPSVDEV